MTKRSLLDFKKAQDGARALLDDAVPSDGERTPFRRVAHFWVMVVRSFVRNRCPVRASALSYTTLLALIPMLAVVVSVTSSLLKTQGEEGINKYITKLVDSVVPPADLNTNLTADSVRAARQGPAGLASEPAAALDTSPASADAGAAGEGTNAVAGGASTNAAAIASLARDERVIAARDAVARQINQFIQNTRSGALGAGGVVLLLFLAISLMSKIEGTFNDIWGVARGRSWVTRVVLYWTTISLGPLLVLAGLGLLTSSQFAGLRRVIGEFGFAGSLLFKVLPLAMLWLVFTFFYQLMPNTKVKWGAAAVGGLVGCALWMLNNVFGFLYVSRVVTNSKIYGSLALVPVFMVGLYCSWLILLFGAQVAYAWQNRAAYLQERLAEGVNQRGREFIALRLMTCIGQRFQRAERPPTISQMSAELGVPSRLIQQVLQTLLASKLIVEVAGAELGFAPARPLETINCHHVLLALRATQGQELATRDEPVRAEVLGEFHRIQEAERQAASGVTLLALVHRAQARLELAAPAAAEDTPTVAASPAPLTAAAASTPKSEPPSASERAEEEPVPFPD